MQWLNKIVDDLIERHPDGEILIESGGSPSGTHHIGHMREFVTADAIMLELRRRGRQARHIYFADDLDALRKVPTNIPENFSQYLGIPLCDVPSPDGETGKSYADFFLSQLERATASLGIEVAFIRSHLRYRSGYFVPAIERSLERVPQARQALETISGRQLDDTWTPIQVLEQGRLKNRQFVSIDTIEKTVRYMDKDGSEQDARYDKGEVKLDWRLDWPGRWWLQHVDAEPSGRDHMTKGSSYDTGVQIMKDVYEAEAPYPVSYDFINMVGDTKKMSGSKGTGLDAEEGSTIMPPEVVRYFILRAVPLKRLYFDPVNGVVQLMDEFAAFAAKTDRTESEEQLLYICTRGVDKKTVSRVPFSHLVASYQAALKDADKTLEIIGRTEYAEVAKEDADIIRAELKFIDEWLKRRAPEEVKFELKQTIDGSDFTEQETVFFKLLGDKIAAAPADADGAWFHNAIYDCKDTTGLEPKTMFLALYRLIIGKTHGPRAGWFLSILPRDWLIKRLHLESLNAIGTNQAMKQVSTVSTDAKLTDDIEFSIDAKVLAAYPNASVGYLVAQLPPTITQPTHDPLDAALEVLANRGVTSENLTEQPGIAAWRRAFGTFGVKPSKYLSSAEALAKRALKGNPAHVSPIVDTYNAVSLANLVPMGALDLRKTSGNIELRYGRSGEQAILLGMDEPIEVNPAQIVYADQAQVVTWLWNHRDAAATAVDAESSLVVFFADSLLGVELASHAITELAENLQALGVKTLTRGVVGTMTSMTNA